MEVQLVSFDAEGQRQVFTVAEGVTTVGRHLECDFQVPSPNISRRHFRLTVEGDAVSVKDMGSSNGTFINERRIHESPLKAGDKLRAADVIFTVVIDGEPAEVQNEAPVEKGRKEQVGVTESTGMAAHVDQTQDLGSPVQLVEPAEEVVTDPLSALAAMSRERQH
jgi:pSer/pThr/pTyr-binding forkhead associated (FHA) protein